MTEESLPQFRMILHEQTISALHCIAFIYEKYLQQSFSSKMISDFCEHYSKIVNKHSNSKYKV